MTKKSHAHGILLVRRRRGHLEIFLGKSAHPRYWGKGRTRLWGLPKGRADEGEESLSAALREFREEVGAPAPKVAYSPFCVIRTRRHKSLTVHTADVTNVRGVKYAGSTLCVKQWRGSTVRFLEFSEAGWYTLKEADKMILQSQRGLIRLIAATEKQQRRNR